MNQDRIYAYELGIFAVADSHQFNTNYFLSLSLISFSPIADAQVKGATKYPARTSHRYPLFRWHAGLLVEAVFFLSLWNSKKTKPKTSYMLLTSILSQEWQLVISIETIQNKQNLQRL